MHTPTKVSSHHRVGANRKIEKIANFGSWRKRVVFHKKKKTSLHLQGLVRAAKYSLIRLLKDITHRWRNVLSFFVCVCLLVVLTFLHFHLTDSFPEQVFPIVGCCLLQSDTIIATFNPTTSTILFQTFELYFIQLHIGYYIFLGAILHSFRVYIFRE